MMNRSKQNARLSVVSAGLRQLGKALAAMLALFGSVQAATDEVVYFHTDALGSPTAAFSESGAVCWTETYSPYGEKLDREDSLAPDEGCGLLDTDVGYTGHVQDDSGLVYAQQRYYDPQIGRFMSTDPITPSEGAPNMFGRYHYANNSPYNYTDPDGMEPGPEEDEDEDGVSQYSDYSEAEYGSGLGYSYEGSHDGGDTEGAVEEFVGLRDVYDPEPLSYAERHFSGLRIGIFGGVKGVFELNLFSIRPFDRKNRGKSKQGIDILGLGLERQGLSNGNFRAVPNDLFSKANPLEGYSDWGILENGAFGVEFNPSAGAFIGWESDGRVNIEVISAAH